MSDWASASLRSRDSIRLQVTLVYIDPSIAQLALTNCAYRFAGHSNLKIVTSFESLISMTTAT